jgi:hypothetical protein
MDSILRVVYEFREKRHTDTQKVTSWKWDSWRIPANLVLLPSYKFNTGMKPKKINSLSSIRIYWDVDSSQRVRPPPPAAFAIVSLSDRIQRRSFIATAAGKSREMTKGVK